MTDAPAPGTVERSAGLAGPAATSWVASAAGSDFGLANLPFGVVRVGTGPPLGVIRIGDEVLGLGSLVDAGLLEGPALSAARAGAGSSLNDLFALGAAPRQALRTALQALLQEGSPRQHEVAPLLRPLTDVVLCLPGVIGDYTDFYVGLNHARNVGAVFRPDNPLLPNYGWVPIGYHGRSSSISVSGGQVRRPTGQTKAPDAEAPTFGPSQRLDFELELGIWVGPGNTLGEPIALDDAGGHIAGYCLLNDWSARDIQAWEYQPLGPFLAKNFATTVSAWVVTPEALAPFRTPFTRSPEFPQPLDYLSSPSHQRDGGLSVDLEVLLSSETMRAAGLPPVTISNSSTRHMFWTPAQMVTHHSSGGCNLRPGDLFGSGTLSGPDQGSQGSLLELTRSQPLALPTGEQRTFLLAGDQVTLRARAHRDGAEPIGFGECTATVLG